MSGVIPPSDRLRWALSLTITLVGCGLKSLYVTCHHGRRVWNCPANRNAIAPMTGREAQFHLRAAQA